MAECKECKELLEENARLRQEHKELYGVLVVIKAMINLHFDKTKAEK